MSIFSDLGVREGKDRLKEELLYNLAACYGLAEKRMAEALAPLGLSTVKMNALMLVKHTGGAEGVSQVDLARKMIVSAGNITRLIDRLEKEGLVSRVPKAGDRRVKVLKITKKGSDLMTQAWPIHKKEVEKIVSLVHEKEVKVASHILNQFRERLGRSSREGISQ